MTSAPESSIKAIVFGCSLKPSPSESSADTLANQLIAELKNHNVESTLIRVVDYIIERLDAELGEVDDGGLPLVYGKVAGVVVVGNEDGAHHICASIYQALNDYGFTIPAAAATYWNGEAMNKVDYKDLDTTPKNVASATKQMAANLAHVARLLKNQPYQAAQEDSI